MTTSDGLLCAHLIGAADAGRELGWEDLRAWAPARGCLWVHLDRSGEQARLWLLQRSGLDAVIAEALLAEETRPRVSPHGEGLLVILRGVNLNPGADPEDMVSLRMWVEESRVISVRKRKVMAVDDIRTRLAAGKGPRNSAQLLASVAARLVDRIAPVISDLDDSVDALEDAIVEGVTAGVREQLGPLRRQAIALRRHMAPQRDVLNRLLIEPAEFFDEGERMVLRETVDGITRHLEDLDAARERAAVCQEELTVHAGEELNRRMYLLSIIAAVFMPLGLLTGLLGINVGGMPGVDSDSAFAIVCGLLLLCGGVQYALLRWFGLF